MKKFNLLMALMMVFALSFAAWKQTIKSLQ